MPKTGNWSPEKGIEGHSSLAVIKVLRKGFHARFGTEHYDGERVLLPRGAAAQAMPMNSPQRPEPTARRSDAYFSKARFEAS